MTLPLPNIPTDNLYKFMSLTGIIIFVITNIVLNYAFYTLGIKLIDVEKDIDVIEIESEKTIKKTEEALLYNLSALLVDTTDKRNLNKIFAENYYSDSSLSIVLRNIKNLSDSVVFEKDTIFTSKIMTGLNEYENFQFERRKKTIEIEAKSKETRQILEYVKEFKITYGILLILSMYLILHGFAKWYFRYQRYQDLIIMKEAGLEKPLPTKKFWKWFGV